MLSRYLLVAASAIAATAFVVFLGFNLSSGEKQITYRIEHRYDIADPQFARSMGVLLGPTLTEGNRVETLLNGDQIFRSMLDAIRSASKTITFETYIYWSGDIGDAFAKALAERARSGVKVHVLLDWVGSQKMDEASLEAMRRAGVEVERYHPVKWYTLGKLNHRTHRKLLVVDGRVGFTGGVGIADKWTGNARNPEEWRDNHYRVEGPVVAELQAAFLDNWIETGGELLHGTDYFPPLDSAGGAWAQAVHSSPGGGTENLRLMVLLAIASARRTILIANPYFVPNTLAVDMLVAARRRGVSVEIIVPGPITDAGLVRRASRAKWGPLLEAGVRIYEYQPTMYHNKLMVVDDYWVSVGSTNFDNRSFRLNDEANLNVFDHDFARQQVEVFDQDRARSQAVTLEEWRGRPITERLEEMVARMLRRQM